MKILVRKDRRPMTAWGREHPWMVLAREDHHPGFTQMSRWATWQMALRGANDLARRP